MRLKHVVIQYILGIDTLLVQLLLPKNRDIRARVQYIHKGINDKYHYDLLLKECFIYLSYFGVYGRGKLTQINNYVVRYSDI